MLLEADSSDTPKTIYIYRNHEESENIIPISDSIAKVMSSNLQARGSTDIPWFMLSLVGLL